MERTLVFSLCAFAFLQLQYLGTTTAAPSYNNDLTSFKEHVKQTCLANSAPERFCSNAEKGKQCLEDIEVDKSIDGAEEYKTEELQRLNSIKKKCDDVNNKLWRCKKNARNEDSIISCSNAHYGIYCLKDIVVDTRMKGAQKLIDEELPTLSGIKKKCDVLGDKIFQCKRKSANMNSIWTCTTLKTAIKCLEEIKDFTEAEERRKERDALIEEYEERSVITCKEEQTEPIPFYKAYDMAYQCVLVRTNPGDGYLCQRVSTFKWCLREFVPMASEEVKTRAYDYYRNVMTQGSYYCD